MRHAVLMLLLILCASLPGAAIVHCGQSAEEVAGSSGNLSTTTLYPPWDRYTGRLQQNLAVLWFKTKPGGRDLEGPYLGDWDLGYALLTTSAPSSSSGPSYQDWFQVSIAAGRRSVIKDLGKHKWTDHFRVRVLAPLPKLPEGVPRAITIGSRRNRQTKEIYARVAEGHIYEVHIKDNDSDYYALLRVEEYRPRGLCKVTWKLIEAPDGRE